MTFLSEATSMAGSVANWGGSIALLVMLWNFIRTLLERYRKSQAMEMEAFDYARIHAKKLMAEGITSEGRDDAILYSQFIISEYTNFRIERFQAIVVGLFGGSIMFLGLIFMKVYFPDFELSTANMILVSVWALVLVISLTISYRSSSRVVKLQGTLIDRLRYEITYKVTRSLGQRNDDF